VKFLLQPDCFKYKLDYLLSRWSTTALCNYVTIKRNSCNICKSYKFFNL